MKRKNCIFRIIIGGLLALLLAVNLWFLGMKLLLNRDLPKLFGFSQAEVLSGSMEPTFFAGDMLIFQTKKEYLVGDIVIFRQNNSFITHRILDQTEEGVSQQIIIPTYCNFTAD